MKLIVNNKQEQELEQEVINEAVTLDVEFSVLGGLMLNNKAYSIVSKLLDETDFHYIEHQFIYRGIKALSEQNKPCDIVIISEWLESHNKLETVGGLAYLGKLVRNTPSAANVQVYAKLVRKFSLQKQLTIAYQKRKSAKTIQYLEEELEKLTNPNNKKGKKFQNIFKEKIKPTQWLIENILPTGTSMLVSKPKVGKSWLALQIANCISAGEQLFRQEQFQAAQGSVLYLALEDNLERLKNRCEMQQQTPIGTYYTRTEGYPKIGEGLEIKLKQDIEETENIRLIIIDTLGKILPAKRSGSYQEDYEMTETLNRLNNLYPQVGILLIHHQRKAISEDNTDSIIGTTGIAGGIDNLLFLKRKNGKVVLETTGKDVEEKSLTISLEKERGTWQYIGETDEILHSENQQQIIDAMINYGAETRSEIEQLTELEGKNLRFILYRMVQKGALKVSGKKGREYTYLIEKVRGYSEMNTKNENTCSNKRTSAPFDQSNEKQQEKQKNTAPLAAPLAAPIAPLAVPTVPLETPKIQCINCKALTNKGYCKNADKIGEQLILKKAGGIGKYWKPFSQTELHYCDFFEQK